MTRVGSAYIICTKPWVQSLMLYKLGVVEHAYCNPNIWEVVAGG